MKPYSQIIITLCVLSLLSIGECLKCYSCSSLSSYGNNDGSENCATANTNRMVIKECESNSQCSTYHVEIFSGLQLVARNWTIRGCESTIYQDSCNGIKLFSTASASASADSEVNSNMMTLKSNSKVCTQCTTDLCNKKNLYSNFGAVFQSSSYVIFVAVSFVYFCTVKLR